MIRYNEAMVLLENKMFIIKRDNVNKYVGTIENLVVTDVEESRNSKEYKHMLTNLYDYVQSIQP